MTYIRDLHNYSDDAAEKEAERVMDDSRRKKLKDEIGEIINDEFDRLAEYAGEFLSQTAADRATKFLERVMAGDEDAIASLIGADYGSRYHEIGYEKGKPWASVIHGRIFETNAMKMRREIVEAHPELIRNERIADLESIVEGLRQQIAKLQDIERSRYDHH